MQNFLQPDVINTWISYEEKYIMNTSYSCRYTAIPRFEQQIQSTFPTTDDGKVFFHTTNWRGAIQIMDIIDTTKSRPCLDFGYSRSFYVSESVTDAIQWGVKNSAKWEDEVAIVAFFIPNKIQKDFDFKDLTKDAEEWKWVVSSFRICKKTRDVIDYDQSYDFMYGPMMTNPDSYISHGPLTHVPPIMQLAAKTTKATRYLYKCMKGAFIFRKLLV